MILATWASLFAGFRETFFFCGAIGSSWTDPEFKERVTLVLASNWVEAVVVKVTLFYSSFYLSPSFLNNSYCSAKNCSKGDINLLVLVF